MLEPINYRAITTGKVLPETGVKKGITSSSLDNASKSFSDILSNEILSCGQMKFSSHAIKRMKERSISLTDKDLGELKNAVSKASDKGIRESLVVIKDIALIVNIPSRTVITAVDGKSLKKNIFTNIDGAMFI